MKRVILSYKQLAEARELIAQGLKMSIIASRFGISISALRRNFKEDGISVHGLKSKVQQEKTHHTCNICGFTKPKDMFYVSNLSVCKPCCSARRVAAIRRASKACDTEIKYCFPTKYRPATRTMLVVKAVKRYKPMK